VLTATFGQGQIVNGDGSPGLVLVGVATSYSFTGTGTSNVPGGWNRTWSENRDIEYSGDGTNWTYAFTTPGIHGSQAFPNVFPADGIYTYPVDFTARYIRFSKGAVGGNYVLISEFYALAPGQTYNPSPG